MFPLTNGTSRRLAPSGTARTRLRASRWHSNRRRPHIHGRVQPSGTQGLQIAAAAGVEIPLPGSPLTQALILRAYAKLMLLFLVTLTLGSISKLLSPFSSELTFGYYLCLLAGILYCEKDNEIFSSLEPMIKKLPLDILFRGNVIFATIVCQPHSFLSIFWAALATVVLCLTMLAIQTLLDLTKYMHSLLYFFYCVASTVTTLALLGGGHTASLSIKFSCIFMVILLPFVTQMLVSNKDLLLPTRNYKVGVYLIFSVVTWCFFNQILNFF